MKVRGTVVCTFTRYKHLLLSPAPSCAPLQTELFYLPSAQLLVLWFTAAARAVLSPHTHSRRGGALRWMLRASLFDLSEAKTRTYFAVCRLRVCVVLFLVPREFTSARWAAIVNPYLGAPKDLLDGEHKDELETEETGLSAFPQKLGFSGKKVLCDEWLSYFCLIDLT